MIGNEEIDMKKYVKPELFYEQFELSKHIASCAWKLNQTPEIGCVAEAEGCDFTLFGDQDTCHVIPDNVEEYCVENGPDGGNVFTS